MNYNVISALKSIYEKKRLRDVRFILISNNCWGAAIYKSIGREYNTPFVGLFIKQKCYIKLLSRFPEIMESELKFIGKSKYYNAGLKYPIGLIEDVEIHFMHYSSEVEAKEKWKRRTERLLLELNSGTNVFFKICDFGSFNFDHDNISCEIKQKNIISFSSVKNENMTSYWSKKNLDGLKLFKERYNYFDITEWLINGRLEHTIISLIFSKLHFV